MFCSNYSCLVMFFVGMLTEQFQSFIECYQRTADKYTRIRFLISCRSKNNTRQAVPTILLLAIYKPWERLEPTILKSMAFLTAWEVVIWWWMEMISQPIISLCTSAARADKLCCIITVATGVQSKKFRSRKV